jgi:hypothetical protein
VPNSARSTSAATCFGELFGQISHQVADHRQVVENRIGSVMKSDACRKGWIRGRHIREFGRGDEREIWQHRSERLDRGSLRWSPTGNYAVTEEIHSTQNTAIRSR